MEKPTPKPIQVPKDLVCQIAKAMMKLNFKTAQFVSVDKITKQVKRQMRGSKPIKNLDAKIKQALENMFRISAVVQSGGEYAIASTIHFRTRSQMSLPGAKYTQEPPPDRASLDKLFLDLFDRSVEEMASYWPKDPVELCFLSIKDM